MTDCNQCDSLFFHILVQMAFDILADGTCAFIQKREFRFMIDQSSNCHSLLFSSRKHISPIINFVPGSFSLQNICQMDLAQNFFKLLFGVAEFLELL